MVEEVRIRAYHKCLTVSMNFFSQPFFYKYTELCLCAQPAVFVYLGAVPRSPWQQLRPTELRGCRGPLLLRAPGPEAKHHHGNFRA